MDDGELIYGLAKHFDQNDWLEVRYQFNEEKTEG